MRITFMATVEKGPQSLPPEQNLPGAWRYLKDLESCRELDQAIQLACEKLGVRTGPERRRVEEDLKLQYHFGGRDVAYLPSDQGRVLIAAGELGQEAFTRALERLDPQDRRRLAFCSPLPWGGPRAFC
jgi:hypothetical protein